MCTLTWTRESSGYQLFSNRDERLTRRPSTSVVVGSREGVRYLAPVDGDFGGTWLAANEYGVSLCLLNSPATGSGRISRGLLVLDLISARSVSEAAARFNARPLDEFTPFMIAAQECSSAAMFLTWDGRHASISGHSGRQGVLSSSSFDNVGVQTSRREQFAWLSASQKHLQTGHLLAFHRSHWPDRGPYSPCMHRHDAETVSFSWLTVTPSHVELYHSAGPPCSSLAGQSATLALRQQEIAA